MTQLTAADMTQLINDYYVAVRSLDVEHYGTKFAENATMEDPAGTDPARSREEAKQRYGFAAMTFSELNMVPQEVFIAAGISEAAVRWSANLRFKETGKLIENMSGISFFRFNDDGLIESFRAFWDTSLLAL